METNNIFLKGLLFGNELEAHMVVQSSTAGSNSLDCRGKRYLSALNHKGGNRLFPRKLEEQKQESGISYSFAFTLTQDAHKGQFTGKLPAIICIQLEIVPSLQKSRTNMEVWNFSKLEASSQSIFSQQNQTLFLLKLSSHHLGEMISTFKCLNSYHLLQV